MPGYEQIVLDTAISRLLAHEILPPLAHPQDHPKAVAVTVLFTAFLALSYLVFYAFAQPETAQPLRSERP